MMIYVRPTDAISFSPIRQTIAKMPGARKEDIKTAADRRSHNRSELYADTIIYNNHCQPTSNYMLCSAFTSGVKNCYFKSTNTTAGVRQIGQSHMARRHKRRTLLV